MNFGTREKKTKFFLKDLKKQNHKTNEGKEQWDIYVSYIYHISGGLVDEQNGWKCSEHTGFQL